MEEFGAYLKREREAREISLDEVARVTRISRRFLDALEECRYEELPELTFVRGFLRAYAEAVGLSASTVVLRYESEVLGTGTRTRPPGEWRRRAITGGAFLLFAAALVFGAWWGSRSGRTGAPPVDPELAPVATPAPRAPTLPPRPVRPPEPTEPAAPTVPSPTDAIAEGATTDEPSDEAPSPRAPSATASEDALPAPSPPDDASNPLADLVGLEPEPAAAPTLIPVTP